MDQTLVTLGVSHLLQDIAGISNYDECLRILELFSFSQAEFLSPVQLSNLYCIKSHTLLSNTLSKYSLAYTCASAQ